LNTSNYGAYFGLGSLYRDQKQLRLAEEWFKKAIELNPKKDGAYFGLGGLYHNQGQFQLAEECFRKSLESDLPDNKSDSYGALATLYGETGQSALAQEYYRKANELRLNVYNSMTTDSYHKLKEILDKRRIKLVCVQYPMRSVEPLKRIFEGQQGIIFVDNEKVFKDAVSRQGYKEYFRDVFEGDFGHCTDKGNRLLAENIASVILKEVFDR
jgi:tetratricopeptide (TPR) repeat protein